VVDFYFLNEPRTTDASLDEPRNTNLMCFVEGLTK